MTAWTPDDTQHPIHYVDVTGTPPARVRPTGPVLRVLVGALLLAAAIAAHAGA